MSYIVKAHHWQSKEKIFEGPLDLLLELIEKEKLEITDLALAQVADQFLGYLEGSKEDITPEHLADFLLVAGKLILIKSKAILPMLELEKEEEEDIEELKARLIEYRKFKEISKEIKKLEGRKMMFFGRQSYLGIEKVFCPPENICAQDLTGAFDDVVSKFPDISHLKQETIKEVISIKDKIDHILQNLSSKIEMTFNQTVFSAKNKIEVVVTFLAMLELVRKNIVVIEQQEMFGEISIKKIEN
ncbi:MAG: segregation/condensation protein A [Minisyncoccia bacterium]